MKDPAGRGGPTTEGVVEHYSSGYEAGRLAAGEGRLESERTRELLERFLPPPPATILDVGGGPGAYACWLAARGYTAHLVDVVPLHVQMAKDASARQPEAPLASAEIGDARDLSQGSDTVDAVLLLGPLYHLTDAADRRRALEEARRVLRPGGVLFAAGISRFASTFDGLRRGFLKDREFAEIVSRDLRDGQHTNPTGKPEYFMSTHFHHPDELRDEVLRAGFAVAGVYGVEGPCWLLADFDEWWAHEEWRARLLAIARSLESEPSVLGASAHLIVVGHRPGA